MASQRPQSGRPMSRSSMIPRTARPPTGVRPPQTAVRMGSGMVPGTGRPETRAGLIATPGVLSAQIKVTERPITQQGLTGMKTGGKGPQRQILDKSYYLGLLRSRINELMTENSKLQKETDVFNQENSVYLSYEKRAESLAGEIKDLQGQLADYNMLVDKLNTNTELEEVMNEISMLKVRSDREAQSIDAIFTEKREKENLIQDIEKKIEIEQQAAEDMVKQMSPEKQTKYAQMKAVNEELLQEMAARQDKLDALMTRKEMLEAELEHSPVKQETLALFERLHEVELRRDALQAEETSRISPQEEREHLLKQVKVDNQEIASMEQHLTETREKMNRFTQELRQFDMDMEDHQGERTQKYKELQRKEEQIDAYLETFDPTRAQDMEHLQETEARIVSLLEQSSKLINRKNQLSAVSPHELRSMQDDLGFKETEMKKSQSTADALSSECERVQRDLLNVEKLEGKVQAEINSLKEKIQDMTEGLNTYRDLNALKDSGEQKMKMLQKEQVFVTERKDGFKKMCQKMNQEHEALVAQLQENETHAQLTNLERKWQHLEQNNFVMKEFIATKCTESDYRPVKKNAKKQLSEYHKLIMVALQGTKN